MQIIAKDNYPSFNLWGGLLEELVKLRGFEELLQTREDLQRYTRDLKLLEEAKTPEQLRKVLKKFSILDRNYLNSVLLDRLCEAEEKSDLNGLYSAISKNHTDCINFLLKIYPLSKEDQDVKEYLDSLPADVKEINVSNRGITYLPNLDRFTQLQELKCYRNSLTTLPVLPNSLQKLICFNNNLIVLCDATGVLPNSLQYIHCPDNKLTTLPALPNSLQTLYCPFNALTILPALPNSLQSLTCHSNNLSSLPALPNSLQYLHCSSNNLTALPTLPNSLQELRCHKNNITALPTLPNSLLNLYCQINNLSSLPTLPNSLEILECHNNNITILPTLPKSLKRLEVLPINRIQPNTP